MDWTLIICLAVAVLFLKGGRKQLAEQSEEEGSPIPPIGLPHDEFVERRAEARRRFVERIRERERIEREQEARMPYEGDDAPVYSVEAVSEEGTSLEEIVNEVDTYKRSLVAQQPKPKVKPTVKPSKKGKREAQIANEAEATEPTKGSCVQDIAEQFDLEQAVIYSELMQPKYKDYE